MRHADRILVERPMPGAKRSSDDPTPVRQVTINLAESPLGWLRARGLVTQRQYAAGELLRRDYERAALAPRVTMNWDASRWGARAGRGAAVPDPTAAQIAAKARFGAAIDCEGPGLADILWRVVCAGETLPVAEKALLWPIRSGRLVLTLALDRIADYYRLANGSVNDGRTTADTKDGDCRDGSRAARAVAGRGRRGAAADR